ncbi:MAG: SAM-dependent methyltransferase [Clostridium sp.]
MDVACLTLGDPTIYSTYIYIHRLVKARGYDAKIINGIPSFCAVSARLEDSLADRSEQIHIIPSTYGVEDALNLSGTKVLMKAASKMPLVKEVL